MRGRGGGEGNAHIQFYNFFSGGVGMQVFGPPTPASPVTPHAVPMFPPPSPVQAAPTMSLEQQTASSSSAQVGYLASGTPLSYSMRALLLLLPRRFFSIAMANVTLGGTYPAGFAIGTTMANGSLVNSNQVLLLIEFPFFAPHLFGSCCLERTLWRHCLWISERRSHFLSIIKMEGI